MRIYGFVPSKMGDRPGFDRAGSLEHRCTASLTGGYIRRLGIQKTCKVEKERFERQEDGEV